MTERRDALLSLAGGIGVMLGFLAAYAAHRWGVTPPRSGPGLFSPVWDNLSVLGWTRDRTGRDNLASAWLFGVSLAGAGLLFLHFWRWRSRLVPSPRLGRAAGVLGGGMGVFLLTVACLPENRFPIAHNRLIFPPVLLGALAILACGRSPARGLESRAALRATSTVIVAAFLISVAIKGLTLPGWLPARPVLPVTQKILILLLAAWTLRQTVLVLRWGRAERRRTAWSCGDQSPRVSA